MITLVPDEPKVPITFVKSEEKFGCAIACLAMIEGDTYDNVRNFFFNDFSKAGMKEIWLREWLGDHGWCALHKRAQYFSGRYDWREEFLRPFTDVHLLTVKGAVDTPNTHLVVMDSNGKIYCPAETEEAVIRDTYLIIDSWGLHR